MKKILIIKDGLSIGGTTSSFLALLYVLEKQQEFEIWVWVNKLNECEEPIPKYVHVVKSTELENAFCRATGVVNKLIELCLNRQILPCLQTKLLKKKTNTEKRLISLYQKMDVQRAKHQKKIDLKNFDAVITWEEFYPAYLLAEAIQANKKIAWIHPDYIQCGFDKKIDTPCFDKLDAVVAVSQSGRESFCKTFPQATEKFKNVRNYVDVGNIKKKAAEEVTDINTDVFTIVTVARIQNISKAFDRAIRVAKRLKDNGKVFRWYIVGGGEDESMIRRLIIKFNLEQQVYLLGQKANPYPYMKRADLFVLQSYYEGRPMVVDESLLLGTPVFATNYAAALEQIKEKYGWVVDNNEEAIYQGLSGILTNHTLAEEKRRFLQEIGDDEFQNPQSFLDMVNEVLA